MPSAAAAPDGRLERGLRPLAHRGAGAPRGLGGRVRRGPGPLRAGRPRAGRGRRSEPHRRAPGRAVRARGARPAVVDVVVRACLAQRPARGLDRPPRARRGGGGADGDDGSRHRVRVGERHGLGSAARGPRRHAGDDRPRPGHPRGRRARPPCVDRRGRRACVGRATPPISRGARRRSASATRADRRLALASRRHRRRAGTPVDDERRAEHDREPDAAARARASRRARRPPAAPTPPG